jgi:hypothetical protein
VASHTHSIPISMHIPWLGQRNMHTFRRRGVR